MKTMSAIHTISGIGERDGGPSRSATSLCSSLARAGINVNLVAGNDRGRDGMLVEPDTSLVRLNTIPVKRYLILSLYREFAKKICTLAADNCAMQSTTIIHDHGIWNVSNYAAAKAAHQLSLPFIVSPRGMLEPWSLKYKSNKKRIAWMLYQNRMLLSCAALVATSDLECHSIKQLFPHLPVAVIPNGVALPKVSKGCGRNDRSPAFNVLFMSRIHPKKNLVSLIEAWNYICQIPDFDHWKLQIAGPDEQGHTLEIARMVKSFGLVSRVEFLGPIAEADKSTIFMQADLFVLPSFSENFGIVVAEALAYGVPVIATTGAPWKSLVDHGCGWWVTPEPDALAQALKVALSKSIDERRMMGTKGKAFVHSTFAWDHIGTMTVQLYEWVLKRSSPVPSFVHL